MSMTLSKNSKPNNWSCGAGVTRAPFNLRAIAVYIVSSNKVDLPPPDTPVTATFTGIISKFEPGSAQEGLMEFSAKLAISGEIKWA